MVRYYYRSQQQEQQNQNNEYDTSDTSDVTENINQEKIIEKVSISDAIRRNSGKIQVTGTITGISTLSKMISKVSIIL